MGKQGKDGRELNSIPLEAESSSSRAQPAPAVGVSKSRPCPKCAATVPSGASACQRCGQAMHVRQATSAQAPVRRACSGCGYDLAGVTSERCPECGKVMSIATIRADSRRVELKKEMRREYLKPLIMIVVSLLVMAAFHLSQGEPEMLMWHGIGLLVTLPTGFVVYFVMCMVWLGNDDPWLMTLFKLAAIYLVCDAVALALAMTGIPLLPSLASMVLYVALLMKMLDLEQSEAIAVGVITAVCRMVVGTLIILAFVG